MAKKQEENDVHVSAHNIPILYTDMIFMNVNDDGVIIDVCQKTMLSDQYQVVTRIGMSKDHAKKFVKKLSEVLVLTTAHSDSTKEN